MSSPGESAPSSAAITRPHTPAPDDDERDRKPGQDDGPGDEGEEDELPEKLKHLLAQSTIYSQIIAEKLQRETEERRKKEGRAEKRRTNKVKRDEGRSQAPQRESRRATKTATNGSSAAAQAGGKAAAPTATRRKREVSLLSSQEGSDDEPEVKSHDFGKDAAKAGKPSTRKAATGSSRSKASRKNAIKKSVKKEEDDSDGSDVEEEDDRGDAPKQAKEEDEEGEPTAGDDEDDESDEEDHDKQNGKASGSDPSRGMQPALVTGATMKSYQVAGMEWLISLYENGLNGILADEMGLGKTLQTIAFLAYLRSKGVWGPFLVCCPLSTLANWVNEFERFTPDIPVVLYHGTPQERVELRAERLAPPTNEKLKNVKNKKGGKASKGSHRYSNTTETFPVVVTSYELVINDRKYLSSYNWKFLIVDESHRIKNLNCKLIKELMSYKSANRLLLTGTPLQNNLEELWSLLNFLMPEIFDDLDSFKSWFNIDVSSSSSATTQIISKLHAILKPFLLRRVKREVEKGLPPKKEYLLSAPLTVHQKKLYDAVIKRQIRDFLLARKDLLPQGEEGKAAFSEDDETLAAATAALKAKKKGKGKKAADAAASSPTKPSPAGGRKRKTLPDEEVAADKKSAKRARPSYAEVDDEDFLDSLDDGTAREAAEAFEDKRFGHIYAAAHDPSANGNGNGGANGHDSEFSKKISSLKLSNMVMQLRKVVNHPWLFDWPTDAKTGELVMDDSIVSASGKMMLLDRLLTELFATGHKVLVFSQFTKQLDIIEDWAVEWKEWPICRIDGTTKQEDRRAQLKEFNEDKSPDAPKLFLLSTRSGGVGINLTGADTVILFDSDWNPQMDLQAMDRAHRLGQTKPVLIFRLVTANTIEAKMLERAGAKRKLEALVIGSGKYTTSLEDLQDIFTGNTSRKTGSGAEEKASGLAAQMFAEEMRDQANGNKDKEIRVIQDGEEVISEKQLQMLLDRSNEAMGRGKGWKSEAEDGGEAKAVEVIETMAAETDDEDTMADLFKGEASAPASPGTEDDD